MILNKSIISDNCGNEIRISNVMQYNNTISFKDFSAKYVLEGEERYHFTTKKVSVSSGEYVFGNKRTVASINIDSQKPVKGICIDIAQDKISDVIDFTFAKNDTFKKFLFEQEWQSKKYNAAHTSLGYAIQQMGQKYDEINAGSIHFNTEIFYAIAECIVKDQQLLFNQFQNLKAVKTATNSRLFDFIYDAKNYIDANFMQKINCNEIAKEAKLSEYHFIRVFKSIFGVTPYKYTINKRLDFAMELLQNNYSITDISILLGYNDVPAFSKAFKEEYGISPKKIISN